MLAAAVTFRIADSSHWWEHGKGLRSIKDWLADLQTKFMIKSVINRSEEILLDELIEWRLVAETTGEHG